ncbi:DUF7239 family protein [Streptomyces globisporus]|uniref:DUF7239 family protein n=1 Tax=Streptomyces globisporus TaxID=1908 RepID=UPI003824F8BA
MSDPREDRLPKWVQEELRRLRGQLAVERQRNEELRGEVGETDVKVQHYGDDDMPLRQGSRVKFQLDVTRWDRYIAVGIENGSLWLHGGGGLTIHPHVSNAFRVTVGRL